MVNAPETISGEQALILSYTPVAARAGFTALLALDAQLAAIVRTTRTPLLGQMRLAWWRDALLVLDRGPAPAHPVLRALAVDVVPVAGVARLAAMAAGWEMLLEDPVTADGLATHAVSRGEAMFAVAAELCAIDDPRIAAAGRGWALADASGRIRDDSSAQIARDTARPALREALTGRWPVAARGVGAMALLARLSLDRPGRAAGHPARAARALWFRATGA